MNLTKKILCLLVLTSSTLGISCSKAIASVKNKANAAYQTEKIIKCFNREDIQHLIPLLDEKTLIYDTTITIHIDEQHYNNSIKKITSSNCNDTLILDNAFMIGVEDYLFIAETTWLRHNDLEKAAIYYSKALYLSSLLSSHKSDIQVKALRCASDFCYGNFNYSTAVELLSKALDLCYVYRQNDEQIVYILNSTGVIYNYMGEKEEAERYYLMALEERTRLQMLYDDDYVLNIIDIIDLYRSTEQFDMMIEYIIELYCVYEHGYDGKEGISFPLYYGYIVKQYQEQADNVFIAAMLKHPVSNYTRFLLLDNIGQFYHDYLFEYTKAEKYYLQALEINTDDRELMAAISTDLGSLYKDIGEYEKAEPLLLFAHQSIHEQSDLFLPTLVNLGDLYWKMGDRQRALESFLFVNKYPNAYDSKTRDKIRCKIGDIYSSLGLISDARDYYQEVIDSFKITLTNYGILWSSDWAWANRGLAWLKYIEGDTMSLISASQHEVEILDMYEYRNNKDYMYAFSFMAAAYALNRDYIAAEAAYRKSLELCYSVMGDNNVDYASDMLELGVIHNRLGKSGLKEIRKAYNIYHKKYITLSSFASTQQRNYFWNMLRGTFENTLPQYYIRALDVDSGITQLAYDVLLFQKGILLSTAQLITSSILNSGDSILINDFREYKKLNEQIYKLQEISVPKSIIDSLTIVAEEKEKLLVNKSISYRKENALWNITWDSVQHHLRNREVAIEFFIAPISNDSTLYCALVLRNDSSVPILVTLFTEQEITHLLNNDNGEPINSIYEFSGMGGKLYEKIWTNILPFISPEDTIYFAPTALLYQLAIEKLPYDANHTMSDHFNMVRLSSTREIVLRNNREHKESATIYGGIQYDVDTTELLAASRQYEQTQLLASRGMENDTTDRGSVKYLWGTKKEAESIDRLLAKHNVSATLYTSTAANEESFKALSGKHQNIIHIGTHGFYWADSTAHKQDFFMQRSMSMGDDLPMQYAIDPLDRCGLLFAGANMALSGHSRDLPEGVQDGILTAKEISLMDLRDCDLVVLSACETAKGDITSEGVFGLQRAFKMAGVQTIIMSLWKVDDNATQMLMTEFYTNWIEKEQSKREAFKNAQNAVRFAVDKYGDRMYADPVYWAGFIMLD